MRIGTIVAPHGLDGGVKLDPASDHVERWPGALRYVWVSGVPRAVRGWRMTRGAPVLRLEGVPDRTAAQQLVGQVVEVAAADLAPLPLDEYYWHDLVGMTVLDAEGCRQGQAVAVMRAGPQDVLEVRGGHGSALVPLVKAWVQVDLSAGHIILKQEPEWSRDAD